jgi:hypothetical protein
VAANDKVSRRAFLSSVAAGLLAAGMFPAEGDEKETGWRDGMKINPDIDNLSVVSCHDPKMIAADPRKWDIVSQNAPIVPERVQADLDAMACALARKNSLRDAWGAIFRKPASKEWHEVKAAIKLNCLGNNYPRAAIVNAVCRALTSLGVTPSNIVLYDGSHNAGSMYGPFIGKEIIAGVRSGNGNELLGGTVRTRIPAPHAGKFKCTAAIAGGDIDVLVNIAVNKGHSVMGTTMTMKNHAGTFEAMPIHTGGGADYIIAFSKSGALLGGDPVRQQLCIVDSIWALTGGPFGIPNKRPAMLSMGTFSPAVDFITAKRIREPIMGCSHPPVLNRLMTDFGYSNFENLDFVRVEPPA